MARLVSIVIAAYNAGTWLAEAVDSALAQTYTPIEIVIVNDGSTDDTAAVLDRYQGQVSIRIITQANQGQSQALSNGFAASRGDYIKFFDADDLLGHQSVAVQVAALEGKPRSLAYGTWGRFTEDPSTTLFTPHPGWHDSEPIDWIVETWRDTEPMYQCALFLIPRALLEEKGAWDGRLGLINDLELFTRLVLASSGIVFTPGATLYYRSNLTGSLSRQKSPKAIASGCLSCDLATDYLIAAEDSPRTRSVAANLLQSFVFSFYPSELPQAERLLDKCRRLGGSSIRPGGGKGFQLLTAVVGWRLALKIRASIRSNS